MNASDKTHRLFFALCPAEKTRQSIIEICSQFPTQKNARVLSPQDFHLTLHFIGQVTDETRHSMHLAAEEIKSEKFFMDLNCYGYFSKAKVSWMGCKKPSTALLKLHKELGNKLGEYGYTSEISAYTPHVSLMRKCAKSDAMTLLKNPPLFSIPWLVDEFVLVESRGGNYRVIERYPLL